MAVALKIRLNDQGLKKTGGVLTLSRLPKAIILGLITALVGLIIGIFPFGVSLEEETGLSLLFRLRGKRIQPSDVVVVSIDKRSSDALGLKNDPRKWPRTLHAELIDRVMEAGAAGIVFDIFFEEPRPGSEDLIFANAVNRSGRVILSQRLLAERLDTPTARVCIQSGLLLLLRHLKRQRLRWLRFRCRRWR